MKRVLMTICVLAAMTSFASASSLTVNGTAALEGSFGLAVTVDNTPTNAYVEDNTPAGETVYRATFLLDVNSTFTQATATTNGSNFITIGQALGDNASAPPAFVPSIRLYLMNRSVEPYCRTRLGVYSNINQRLLGPPTGIDCSGPVEVTIEWTAGAAGTGMGRLTTVSPVIGTRSTEKLLSNHLQNVQYFRIGHAVGTIIAPVSGTMYFDSFESYRTLAP